MTAYPPGYQLGHNHVFFDPSRPHEQRVGVYHEAGSEDAVQRSTPRYFPPSATTTPHLSHSQLYSDVNSISSSRTVSRSDCSNNEEEDDSDSYGLHYYYGKTWNSGTSDPVNFDARIPVWRQSTATNSTSSAEWSADSVHRPLPHNQIPMQRPPELYESNPQHVPTLGVFGHSHPHSSAPPGPYAPLQSNGPVEAVIEYPMSRLSRLPQGILPSHRYNVNNPFPHPPPYPHPRQCLVPLMIYQPTQEELDGAAHAPVPPEKLSSYSELSPHIEFMERLKFEESLEKTKESRNPAHNPVMDMDGSILPPSSVISSATKPKRPFNAASTAAATATATVTANATANPVYLGGPAPGVQAISSQASVPTATPTQANPSSSPSFIPPPAKKRRRSKNTVADSAPDVEPPSHRASESSSNPNLSPEENGSSSPTISSNGIKYIKSDPRKPSLACTFCRERKISCGRPPAGSQDLTCNQCARRSFKCEYITEIPSPPKTTNRRRQKPSLASTSPPK